MPPPCPAPGHTPSTPCPLCTSCHMPPPHGCLPRRRPTEMGSPGSLLLNHHQEKIQAFHKALWAEKWYECYRSDRASDRGPKPWSSDTRHDTDGYFWGNCFFQRGAGRSRDSNANGLEVHAPRKARPLKGHPSSLITDLCQKPLNWKCNPTVPEVCGPRWFCWK